MGLFCLYIEKYRAKAMPIQKLARFIVPFLNPKNPWATVYCFITIVMGSKKLKVPTTLVRFLLSEVYHSLFILVALYSLILYVSFLNWIIPSLTAFPSAPKYTTFPSTVFISFVTIAPFLFT